MRFIWFSLLIILSMLIAGCGDPAAPVSVGDRPISVNNVPQPGVPSKPVENMTWTDFDGKRTRLGDLKGKAVILDFWATYCKPCIQEIPHLMELQNQYGTDNLVVVGLHVGGEDDRPLVPEFVRRLSITYELAEPEPALTSYIFGGQNAIPQTAVFDRNGKLIRKIIGFSDAIKLQLDDAVKQAVETKN